MHAFQPAAHMSAAKRALLSQAGAPKRHHILVTSLCFLQAVMSKGQALVPHLNPHILPYPSCAQLETPLFTALCTCGCAREQDMTYAYASMYWASKHLAIFMRGDVTGGRCVSRHHAHAGKLDR